MRFLLLISIIFIFANSGWGQQYEFSNGLYRIGYEDAVPIYVVSDAYTHNPPGKYDIITDSDDPYIVAGADGWIRWIVEGYSESCPPEYEGGPCCWEDNNYVVMEHPNGEWSLYEHIQQGSATSVGISVDDWVTVGTPLGIEGNVGCSYEDHLHFEVSRPDDPTAPFDTIGGGLDNLGELLIPVICGIQPDDPWLSTGEERIASPCDDDCQAAWEVNNSVGFEERFIARADAYIVTGITEEVVFSAGSTTQFRAGDSILLKPGFHVEAGAKFAALLKGCTQ